jgi:hypothetical protein
LFAISTLMFMEAPSAAANKNPDVLLQAFSTSQTVVDAYAAMGASASLANITKGPTGAMQTVDIDVGGVSALHMDLAQLPGPASSYNFSAVYAVPANPISWYWGLENSPTVPALAAYTLGPAVTVANAFIAEREPGRLWTALNLHYVSGVPPA